MPVAIGGQRQTADATTVAGDRLAGSQDGGEEGGCGREGDQA